MLEDVFERVHSYISHRCDTGEGEKDKKMHNILWEDKGVIQTVKNPN
jgi:hypothetical protein